MTRPLLINQNTTDPGYGYVFDRPLAGSISDRTMSAYSIVASHRMNNNIDCEAQMHYDRALRVLHLLGML